MTVEEMRARMGNSEWIAWSIYYGRRSQDREIAEAQARARRG